MATPELSSALQNTNVPVPGPDTAVPGVTVPGGMNVDQVRETVGRDPHNDEALAREMLQGTTHGLSENQTPEEHKKNLFESFGDMVKRLWGKPESDLPDNQVVANRMWEYLKNNEGNADKRAMVMRKISSLRSHFIEAIRKRLNDHMKVVDVDRKKLNTLMREVEETEDKGLQRMLSIMGQAMRKQDNVDVMNSEELLGFEQYLSLMEQVDLDELVDIIIEDQPFVSMLASMRNRHDQRIFNDSFAEEQNRTNPLEHSKKNDKLMTVFYDLSYTDELHSSVIDRVGLGREDVVNPQTGEVLPDKGKMINHHYYVDLAQLIAGNERGKSEQKPRKHKSENRTAVEAALWVETVRYMTPDQKQYLAYSIKDEFNDSMVKEFVKAGTRSGVLNTMDIEQMGKVPGLSWLVEPAMKSELDGVKAWREDNKKNITAFAHQMENHYMQNSFLERGIGGLVGMGFSVVGAITMMVNIIMPFSDAYNDSKNDTWGKKIKDGLKRAATNGMLYLGVGEMMLGRHLITPFTYNEFYSMTASERAVMSNAAKGMAFDAAVVNNTKLASHMIAKWDEYAAIAKLNKNNRNPKQGKENRGEYRLYEGDIKMTEDEAKGIGYTSAKAAEADIMGVFQTATGLYGIESKEKFHLRMNEVVALYAPPDKEFVPKDGESPLLNVIDGGGANQDAAADKAGAALKQNPEQTK